MTPETVIDLVRDAIFIMIVVSAPVLIISTAVGLVISILQTTTSIQEQTLAFVPKILAVLFALVYFGYFILGRMMDYSMDIFRQIPNLAR